MNQGQEVISRLCVEKGNELADAAGFKVSDEIQKIKDPDINRFK